jgi:hypothetical protein
MKYAHIGWCHEDSHDKVWGIIQLTDGDKWDEHDYVSFWGRRGRKLQTKVFKEYDWTVEDMFNKKLNKGYTRVDEAKLNEVYPEFEADLKKMAFWSTFKI